MPRVKYLPVSDGRRLHIEDYPNFDASGSIAGMKKHFYGEDALLVRCGSRIYHVGNESRATKRGSDIYYSRAH